MTKQDDMTAKIIFDAEGNISLKLPKLDADELVPDHIVRASAIFVMLTHHEEEITPIFEQILKDMNEVANEL